MSAARDLLPTIPRGPYAYRTDPAVHRFDDDRPLVIFDGHCGLCSRLVRFVLKHDHEAQYRFLAAQTAVGETIYRHFGLNAEDYDTFILLREGKGYFASTAAIELFHSLGMPWSLLGAATIVPQRLRDRVYLWIAHNRMRVFGRTDGCYLPAAEHRDRFLSGQTETETAQP